MTAIHVSIPVRVLEDFDATLGFTQSRSAAITKLIQSAEGEAIEIDLYEATTRQLMVCLSVKPDLEPWFSRVLLEILAKSP